MGFDSRVHRFVLHQLFKKLDVNGNGVVDYNEVLSELNSLTYLIGGSGSDSYY